MVAIIYLSGLLLLMLARNLYLHPQDSRLLMQLFNCVYTRRILLSELGSNVKTYFPQAEKAFIDREVRNPSRPLPKLEPFFHF